MALAVKPKQMKLLLGSAGILGFLLRKILYTAGVDRKGLLIAGYWADTCLWILSAAVAALLILWCRQLTGSKEHQKAFPKSAVSAAGTAVAGIALILFPAAQAPSQALAGIESVLRFAAASSLVFVSYCRFRGQKPFFLLHCAVCLYLALRLVCQYRIWSADPQIQNYAFYLGAHVALMITAYQLAAFDAGVGSHSKLWAAGLSTIYLATVSLAGSSEPFFLILCIIWVWTNLSRPSSGRRTTDHTNPTQEES